MPKLVQKSGFVKANKAGRYMKYIATREGVEKLEENSTQDPEVYMRYIATRPRAERHGSHGLFSAAPSVDLNAAMKELSEHDGNVWTVILSLRREDAARWGFDNAAAWRDLLMSHQPDLADAMKIPADKLRWYAAFHDEGEHPHIHMMLWSDDPKQGFLTKKGIELMRSKLTNAIFRQEMLHLYERKGQSRDELVREARRAALKLARELRNRFRVHPEAERLMRELVMKLDTVAGKKTYGHLKKDVKKTVEEIVDQMERLPEVKACYDAWLDLQHQVASYYSDKPMERLPLSRQKEFRSIKNAVILVAEQIRSGNSTFEDKDLGRKDEQDDEVYASDAYWELRAVICDESCPLAERDAAAVQLQTLAESGAPHAQYLMGRLYRDGPLLTPDSVIAKFWLERAARSLLNPSTR